MHGFTTPRLLGLRVRIPLGALIFVSCDRRFSCEVEVSATGRSLVERSPTEYGVSECDIETAATRRAMSTRAVESWKLLTS
jgi:hypothetical protein